MVHMRRDFVLLVIHHIQATMLISLWQRRKMCVSDVMRAPG